MLKNYLTITLRTLRRHKGYALINISGLAVGMACCLLVILFIRDERSFDRFHEKADRTFQVTIEKYFSGMRGYSGLQDEMTQDVLATLPGVEQITRMQHKGRVVVQRDEQLAYEDHLLMADTAFFDIFTFPLQRGNPETALAQPYTVVLTPAVAEKYFGDADPIGQTLLLDGKDTYEVTGVLAEAPRNTHLQFDLIGSLETLKVARVRYDARSYFLLQQGYTGDAVHADLMGLLERHMEGEWTHYVEAVPDIYLQSEIGRSQTDGLRGDMRYIYMFSTIALLILLIACVNYMNLATARVARRSREVGIRKVVGARRGQLIRQFMGESIMISFLALGIALGIAELLMPGFNAFVGKDLSLQTHLDRYVALLFVGIAVGVGILAGGYPALVLSAFKPAVVLKGSVGRGGWRQGWLRKGLVVFQFGVSAFLIISTLIIQQQLDFVQNQRLGFDDEQVVLLRPKQQLEGRYAAFKQALVQETHIRGVTMAPLPGGSAFPFRKPGEDETLYLNAFFVDFDFLDLMDIDVRDGRGFSEDVALDARNALVVNEAAVKHFEWTQPLGEQLETYDFDNGGYRTMEVIGVVEDFHDSSLRHTIRPMFLFIRDNPGFGYILVKVNGGAIPEALATIEEQWAVFEPGYPFEYTFMDDKFAEFYKAEQRLGQIFGIFSFLAIFIACLGLFGLVSFMTEQRTKEIGIRKALGASVPGITVLLSKEFLRLVVVAAVIVTPLAYISMDHWLQDFAYHIDITVLPFLLAGVLALAIAVLTVSFQAIKAALTNPVEALRYE